MKTQLINLYPDFNLADLRPAARAIREGQLVAFPTETVYGLGASALAPEAIKQVFRVKGRPQDNPLIVHLSKIEDLDKVAVNIPETAYRVLEDFAPGPLTIIVEKAPNLSDEITAGLTTVAIRFPENRVARALIEEAGVPIVAPSANLSGKPSPTKAWHVMQDLDGKVPYVLDGGPCRCGLESTILDLTSDPAEILRPGLVSASEISRRTGLFVKDYRAPQKAIEKPKAPGQKYRHYSPTAKVLILGLAGDRPRLERLEEGILNFMATEAGLEAVARKRLRLGLFFADSFAQEFEKAEFLLNLEKKLGVDLESQQHTYDNSQGAGQAAHDLFDQFREFDRIGVDLIICTAEASKEAGIAYMNRLGKAASYRV